VSPQFLAVCRIHQWASRTVRPEMYAFNGGSASDTGLSEVVGNPLFANIKKDPRWLPFLRKIGKAPEQLAAITFDVSLPQ
jgi:hypothetical protein